MPSLRIEKYSYMCSKIILYFSSHVPFKNSHMHTNANHATANKMKTIWMQLQRVWWLQENHSAGWTKFASALLFIVSRCSRIFKYTARKTRGRKWFHFVQRYRTNRTHNQHVTSLRRFHVCRIKKMKLWRLIDPFFLFSSGETESNCSRARRAISRRGSASAYWLARSKGYAIPDGHVSTRRTGNHEEWQALAPSAWPYKGVCV